MKGRIKMENLFISHLNEKDVNHFTTDLGLYLRKKSDVPFKKLCHLATNANIIKIENEYLTDEDYFNSLKNEKIPLSNYAIDKNKNNIIVERYPVLKKDEPYIFVANHTCPEDIETFLNIIERNAYVVLGSIETLKYNPEMYLLWLNGMIPFDILNEAERQELYEKMKRVIKTNSILIFPEGSHNYSPNNIINSLFDGPVNLALETKRKIVLLTLVKDKENNVAYIDASHPIDVTKLKINSKEYYPNEEKNEKYYVKSISSYLRDQMATSVYYMMERHLENLTRRNYRDIETYFKYQYIFDAFSGLKWRHDCFEAEYLVKKTKEEKKYEEVVSTLSHLGADEEMKNEYRNKKIDLENKDVARYMREYWLQTYPSDEFTRKLKKVG